MVMLYVLNTPILTEYGDWQFTGPLDLAEVKQLLQQPFTSAVGHQGAADFLTTLLDISVPLNRISIRMQAQDQAIVLKLKSRMPEGIILSKDDMMALDFELGLLTRIK
ncbi:MAG: hypothetical protein RL368_88 [Pseudomonadota bacterium]|jgi:hypothetical protein